MKFRFLISILLLGIFINAQNNFEIKNGDKVVIPFKLINNLIFIPININGAELTFMLDTGVTENTIFSLENKEIKLGNMEKMKFSGLGGNKSIEGYKSDLNTGKIGKNFINDSLMVYIIQDEEFNISSHIGIPVNGFIGYHFFKDYPLIIDYTSKKITVFKDRALFEKKIKKFDAFAISVEKSKPYIMADVEMTNEKKPSKLLIDIGNSDPIWLFPVLIKDFVYNRPNIEDYLGRGFNGDIYGKRSRIHQLDLGKFKFEKPLTAMPDEFSIQHINLAKDRKGSVGGEIMRRFTVAFDYKNEKIYLRKNKNYGDPFHFNMSGLDFKQDGLQWDKDYLTFKTLTEKSTSGDIQTYNSNVYYKFVLKPLFSIAGVRKDSPAGKAGLKKDDQLLIINGKKTSDMTLNKIMDIMKSEEGKTINMTIDRKGLELKFSFTLEDPIPYQE
ncbi:aspartyl protease family protein [Chryseobacterium sp. Ch-15]|uniref:Aspartyl protease family protein n=1 Tax=Chryseobacterium muglaense TaxID=2893752 RepID=A0A9Q3YX33_9FLAO|nr:aspartyl protease family protein [Chryseobacterium muglaense]MBD3903425.1 aspartyl protease family protein [Chryseobacterium muglaense]MCC9036325.1 aspartyl protease family protein [Chryseobacterium muglaense]MCM2557019.1 aspartyl protease family protein [Chryseobacterium muglaense]